MITSEQTAAFKQQLEEQQDELRREIVTLGADPDGEGLAFADDPGFSDRSRSTEERSRLISVVQGLRSNLRQVERALKKIEDGTYGACDSCGREISPERLDALPWALLCIDCKQKAGNV